MSSERPKIFPRTSWHSNYVLLEMGKQGRGSSISVRGESDQIARKKKVNARGTRRHLLLVGQRVFAAVAQLNPGRYGRWNSVDRCSNRFVTLVC